MAGRYRAFTPNCRPTSYAVTAHRTADPHQYVVTAPTYHGLTHHAGQWTRLHTHLCSLLIILTSAPYSKLTSAPCSSSTAAPHSPLAPTLSPLVPAHPVHHASFARRDIAIGREGADALWLHSGHGCTRGEPGRRHARESDARSGESERERDACERNQRRFTHEISWPSCLEVWDVLGAGGFVCYNIIGCTFASCTIPHPWYVFESGYDLLISLGAQTKKCSNKPLEISRST